MPVSGSISTVEGNEASLCVWIKEVVPTAQKTQVSLVVVATSRVDHPVETPEVPETGKEVLH